MKKLPIFSEFIGNTTLERTQVFETNRDPCGHDEAGEVEIPLEVGKGCRVLASPASGQGPLWHHPVVGTHHRAHATGNGSLEWREVHLEERKVNKSLFTDANSPRSEFFHPQSH